MKIIVYFTITLLSFNVSKCEIPQMGPDPWNHNDDISSKIESDADIPPDLKFMPKRKGITDNNVGPSDLFYKRMLAIILKFGQVQQNEDDTVEVSLQMKFDAKRWKILNDYIISNTALSEEMYRRSLGYIEEAIYKQSGIEIIFMSWKEYIQSYLVEYKMQITWTLSILAVVAVACWLWSHMSHKHIIILLFGALYLYEVFVSYKEAEQQEVQRFISSMNSCKWRFWSSECEVPPPDPVIFLKHMNPLKIAIRMFTTLISEPMITISVAMQTMIHGIADGLWFPFDKIVYGVLVITFNLLLLFLLIMVVFNYILNIPFHLSLFAGLLSVGVKQRKRTLFSENNNQGQSSRIEGGDRISGATLDKILDVCSRALTNTRAHDTNNINRSVNNFKVKRSASTGRLNAPSSSFKERLALEENIRRRNVAFSIGPNNGGGDAH